ncbi:alkylation response protein AidB-like acyl-CoA dehydrogenase [Actinocorallia herbida]|uniref:Alkylation response protein AidB-like acyl-CoA dehydrogenase n=1 Tax=Actinocorallia herbida TaxID=58109 RepID=A0A3N1D3A6_9ACTN|nr:acyl-CoA dehydrogenase family protein [Actinocorallia herbida]ROO88023.1 alkylation response protein AidB-like acyl-CoA dehydrogenase [Actinocorallia herbida]
MSTALVPRAVRLGPQEEQLRAEVRAFVAEELAAGTFRPRSDSWLTGWDEAFSRRLGERGWLGMTVPRAYGGHDRTALERYVVTEELLAAGAPVAAHWIADRQTAPALLHFGTEALKTRYLPGIAAGTCFFAIGLSEPDAGSDLAAVRTRAVRAEGGWRLTGTKVWTSGAHHAHAFAVLARSSPAEGRDRKSGLSQFVVDLRSPGVTIRPIRLINGAHHFNEVVLDDVFVPDEMVLGVIGQGWNQATSELAFERSGPERYLSTFPLLTALVGALADAGTGRAELGRLVSRVWTVRRLSISVAAALDRGEVPEVAAALVKDLGTRLEQEIIDAARLLVDARPDPGATDGLPRLLADAVLMSPGFTLRGGTNEILRGVVARAMGMR